MSSHPSDVPHPPRPPDPDSDAGSPGRKGAGASSAARRRLLIFGVGVGVFLLSRLASLAPGVVEALFARGWASAVVPPLSRATGAVPFSLVEPLLGAYLLWRLVTAARATRDVRRGARRVRAAAGAGGLLLLRDLGVGLLLFYLLWGFHYARAPLDQRVGLPELDTLTTEELIHLSRELVEVANGAYVALHGTEDAGTPTAWPREWDRLGDALERGWGRADRELGLGPLATAELGDPKPFSSSALLARLGISGFYFPFTAEPLVNATAPPVFGAASLAHEQAHQRGITSEGEASFLGFVAAMASDDPLLRYAAAARIQGRFLRLLALRDTASHGRVAALRVPGLVRDLADYARYQRRYAGPASDAARRVNDAYLRSQGVPGGRASYGEVTRLLLRYARGRGGTLLPAGVTDAPGG